MSGPIPLQLGDVVGVLAPTNPDLNKKYFIIEYLSTERMVLRGDNGEDHILGLDSGVVRDHSIANIKVVDRPSEVGYAKQHGLIPDTWINIQFGGDMPMIIVGKIIGLDEDMIDVKTFPGGEHVYIDFEYQGIPRALDIENITIRSEPVGAAEKQPPVQVAVSADEANMDAPETPLSPTEPFPPPMPVLADDTDLDAPAPDETPGVVVDLKDEIAQGDIIYGKDLGAIVQEVDVGERKRKYPLEAQLNDMLDDILASIPLDKRTPRRMAAIQTDLERYKELREQFTVFDSAGAPTKSLVRGAQFRPLVDALKNLDSVPSWILPVTRNTKKVYNVEGEPPYGDVEVLSLQAQLADEQAQVDAYESRNVDADGENSYAEMVQDTRPFSTPYSNPPSTEVLGLIATNNPVTSVVNNLDSLESSVFVDGCCLEKTRFALQPHSRADEGLVSVPHAPGTTAFAVKPLTAPDVAGFIGFMTLPTSVAAHCIREHRGSVIADKLQMADTNAKLQSSLVRSAPVTSETIEEFGPPTAEFSRKNELTLFELDDDLFADEDRLDKFLSASVPFTKQAITIMEPYAKRRLTYLSVTEILSPFAVAPDDITYKQYNSLSQILHKNIVAYRKRLGQNRNAYDKYARIHNSAFARYREPFRLPEGLLDAYGIGRKTLPLEILADAIEHDGARAFLTALGEKQRFSYEYGAPPPEAAARALVELQDARTSPTPCTTRVIARVYRSREELEADKSPTFSAERDPTDYTLINKVTGEPDQYAALIDILEAENPAYLVNGASTPEREASAIMAKRRDVIQGEYAVLVAPSKPLEYFKWSETPLNGWIPAPEITNIDFIPDAPLFCLDDPGCAYIKGCQSTEQAALAEEIAAVRTATEGFELEKTLDEADLAQRHAEGLQEARRMLGVRNAYKATIAARARSLRAEIGADIDLGNVQDSPYQQLFEAIMAQNDFPKKQHDILRFSAAYTESGSSEWMRNCKETGKPILPTFLVMLAEAFSRGTYTDELDQICRIQGVLSDGGDTWVDKHSGYVIRTMEFDTTEGFDEEGYQIVSRDLVQQDIAESVLQKEYADEASARIAKVAKGFASQLGANLGDAVDFVVHETRILLNDLLPDKAAYEQRLKNTQKRGKRGVPYDFAYNNMMLYIVICLVLVSIQSAVPPLKITRTFPGCRKSFTGYPLVSGDMSAMNYIACVASKLRSSSSPWDTIQKMKADALLKKLESTMARVIKSRAVLARLRNKAAFLEANPEIDDSVAPEYDVKQWSTFLPPLATPNVEPVRQLQDAFFIELSGGINRGAATSTEGIQLIAERTRTLSFGIQEAIQGVVNSFEPVLRTTAGVPFLENACCNDDGRQNTASFFASQAPAIETYNRYASRNMRRYYTFLTLAKAPAMHYAKNTRIEFPPVSEDASPEVIYTVMLHYCQYNKPTFIGDKLTKLCGARDGPLIDGMNASEATATLKAAGIEYTLGDMNALSVHLADENRLNTMMPPPRPPAQALTTLLDSTSTDIRVEPALIDGLRNVLDMYGAKLSEGKSAVDALRNVALTSSDRIRRDIKDFVRRNGAKLSPPGAKFLDSLQEWDVQPETWTLNATDATSARIMSFTRDAILSAGRTMPSIVANAVRYDDVSVPSAWGLSQRHVSDVKTFVARQYAQLGSFYDNDGVAQVCEFVVAESNTIAVLQALTPLLPARGESESVFNAKVVKELNEIYLLSVLELYIIKAKELESVQNAPSDPVAFEFQEDEIGTPNVDWREQVGESLRSQGTGQSIIMRAADDAGPAAAVEFALAEAFDPRVLKQEIAKLICVVLDILAEEKRIVDVGVATTKERTLKAKEKEKDEITSYLRDLSDEERQAQDVLKNNRLGAWGKGHTKGLIHYVQDVYDDEVAALEQRAEIDMRLGERNEVTDMNRDIYVLDMHEQSLAASGIQEEVDDISALPDDDDYGEGNDGDM